jgi:hypothetical protein
VEEAKLRAEKGYRGIAKNWRESPYSADAVNEFLRNEYDVDPASEWWKEMCSFCGGDGSDGSSMLRSEKATICQKCVENFYEHFRSGENA